jgi:hypothetical protein
MSFANIADVRVHHNSHNLKNIEKKTLKQRKIYFF